MAKWKSDPVLDWQGAPCTLSTLPTPPSPLPHHVDVSGSVNYIQPGYINWKASTYNAPYGVFASMYAWPSLTFNIYQYDVSTCRLSLSLRTSTTSSFRLSLLPWRCATLILLIPTCCSIISRYRVIPRFRTPEVEVVLKTNVGEIGRGGPDTEMEAGTGHNEFGTSLNGWWWVKQTDKQMNEQNSKWYDSDMMEDAQTQLPLTNARMTSTRKVCQQPARHGEARHGKGSPGKSVNSR